MVFDILDPDFCPDGASGVGVCFRCGDGAVCLWNGAGQDAVRTVGTAETFARITDRFRDIQLPDRNIDPVCAGGGQCVYTGDSCRDRGWTILADDTERLRR